MRMPDAAANTSAYAAFAGCSMARKCPMIMGTNTPHASAASRMMLLMTPIFFVLRLNPPFWLAESNRARFLKPATVDAVCDDWDTLWVATHTSRGYLWTGAAIGGLLADGSEQPSRRSIAM